MSTVRNYFVYALLDLRKKSEFVYSSYSFKNEPFYIGVSYRKDRLNEHFWKNQSNNFKQAVIDKILKEGYLKENMVSVLLKNLTKEEAFEKEKELISLIGRRNKNLGPLTNLSSGGEGTYKLSQEQREELKLQCKLNPSFKNKKHTEESKEKARKTIGDSRKGVLNANYGKRWTSEQKEQASIKQKENLKHLRGENNPSKRKEVRLKISETKLGKKNPRYRDWILISPTGYKKILEGGNKLNEYLISIGLLRKSFSPINGYYKNKDGWYLQSIKQT